MARPRKDAAPKTDAEINAAYDVESSAEVEIYGDIPVAELPIDFSGVEVVEDEVSYTFKGSRGHISIAKASGIEAIQGVIDRVK